ncbi:MAG: PAS domain S-box protein [Anaerolineae bacterium]|nr:PAS domain S-box protein [Anaerolineae bacterium]
MTYLLLDVPSGDRLYTLVFMILGAAVVVGFIYYRDRAEADRQRVIATARDELRASRELYRTLARNLPQSAVLLFDHDLRLLLVEGTALAQLGYSRDALEGQILTSALVSGEIDHAVENYRAALAGEERTGERLIGSQYYRAHYLPVRGEDGEITAGMVLLQNIHEQKRAELALRESEERYRLIAENATDLISVQSPERVYLYASPASRTLLGYEPDELVGHPLDNFLHPEDVDRVRRVFAHTLDSSEVVTIAYRIRRKGGSYTWLESASRQVTNPTFGAQVVAASRDVSERMNANDALRRSEELFQSLVASMDNLVFSIDLNGRFLVYHSMPSSIYDTPFDTDIFVGKHYSEVLPSALVARLEASIPLAMSALATQQTDYSLHTDGEERYYSARISPMIGESLQLLGSTVVVGDVTEATRARQRQQRLLAYETIQREIGMLFLEADDPNQVIDQVLAFMGTFLEVSRAYMVRLRENERLLDNVHEWVATGVSPEMRNLQGIAYDEIYPSLLPLLANEGVIASENIHDLPTDLSRAFEATGIQSVLILPFYVDQRLDGFVGFDDVQHARPWLPEEITAVRAFVQGCARVFERQRAQLALIEARDTALRSAKLKTEFVSNMSHEIRTPMTGVIGMLDLLRETALTTDQTEYVQIAHTSANRLMTLIGDILDFSKIEAGKVALENIPLDVRGLITEVHSLFSLQASKKQIQLTATADDGVPARVLGDPTRIRQVLMNLVGNAIKFTERGSIAITVKQLNAVYGRARLRFEVTDTGIGIPADRQAQVFDSFVQADSSTTRRYGGAGLGLAICRQLVELMDGEIDLMSKQGEGSTFGFTIVVPIIALANREAINTDFRHLQLLVMDDDNNARYLLAEQLRLWGANVIEAQALDEARNLLTMTARREEEVDIFLFRCNQPMNEQSAFVEGVRQALGVQTPLLVQLYDDDTLTSSAFDLRLHRPVHPSDLHQLLEKHDRGDFVQEISPLREDQMLAVSNSARILVADDEAMNRQIVVYALEQFGYIVDTAPDGQAVLDKLEQQTYEVILMDMQMPVMDGMEATRRIRAKEGDDRAIPIIAFTASIEREERQRYFDNGVTAIIGKPYSLRELRQTIEACITQK